MEMKLICFNCGKVFKPSASQKHYQKLHSERRSFCIINCYHAFIKGEGNPKWRGGKTLTDGYVYIYKPDHPFATQKGYVAEHRLIVEKLIGRYLDPKESVHHTDGNKLNNSIENLALFQTEGEHRKLHSKYRTRENGKFNGHKENINLYI